MFFEFERPGEIGHNVIHYPEVWAGPIGDHLDSLKDAAHKNG
jgi:hypothetical protein